MVILIILVGILSIICLILGYAVYNLLKKNEFLEDFIYTQSEAISVMDKRVQEIDERGIFHSDDEIGWFFKELKKIQEALNEFNLR